MLDNGYKHLYDEVRNITRLCGGDSANYANVISKGIALSDFDRDDPDHPSAKEYDTTVEAYTLFPMFVEFFPAFEEHIDFLADNDFLVQKIAKFCTTVAKKSRTDDLARVKDHLFVVAKFEDAKLATKLNRGFNHVESAKMILPPPHLAKFLEDSTEFCRLVKISEIELFSEDWPMFMYDMALYREGQQKPGFLKSHFLVNMVKTVFTSFSSTDCADPGTSSGKGQPTVAQKHGMTKITIHAVLYVAVLCRSALTSYGSWSEQDGDKWNVKDFIHNILTFMHQNADWVDDLTRWWNEKVFGQGDEDTEETRQERSLTSFRQAMANECTGRRKPPAVPRRIPSEAPGHQDDAQA
ncbi:hypothetical protein C8Q80DRAFT_1276327 [Daedaleopsis nitida]|nr:hypothetical protein C8Q80DRAFT_1276327 [Daedaleopsis nitida]